MTSFRVLARCARHIPRLVQARHAVARAVRLSAAFLVAWSIAHPTTAHAQIPDSTFVANVQPAQSWIYAGNGMVVQPDGRVLLAGYFSHVNGVSVQSIVNGIPQNVGVVRLLSDGSLDPSFSPAVSNIRQAVAVALQTDGRIVVRGYTRNAPFDQQLFRLNANGTLDSSFTPSYLDGMHGLVILDTGKILLLEEYWVARFNADGTRDNAYTAFGVPGGTAGGYTGSLEKRPDGSILVGGGFLYGSSTALHPVIRLNAAGEIDTSFVSPAFASSVTRSTATRPDGRIVIAGDFRPTVYELRRIYLLEADGTSTSALPLENIWALASASQTDGGVVLGTLDGSSGALRRLMPDGLELDSSFAGLASANTSVAQVVVQSDGRIIAMGEFGGTNIARFLPESAVPPNAPPVISPIADQTVTYSPSGRQIGPLSFTATDPQGTVPTVTAATDNPAVIPQSGIVLGGSGSNRTITIAQPPAGVPGTAHITLTASDGSLSTTRTFTVTVQPQNRPPTISGLPGSQTITAGAVLGPFPFSVSDPDGQLLTVRATSSNTAIIPSSGLVLGGSGTARTLIITSPGNSATGLTTITVTASDGLLSTSASFQVRVNPSTIPGAPRLTLANPYANPVALSWSAGPGAAPQQYVLQAGTQPGASNLGTFPIGLQTSIVTAAPAGFRIYARVVAVNQYGAAASNEVLVFVGGAPAPGGPLLTGQTTQNPISLSWAPGVGGPALRYVLMAGTTPGASNLGVFPMGQARAVSVNAPVGIPIHVRVVAENTGGTAVSNELAFTVAPPAPPPPPVLAAPVLQAGTAYLSWSGGRVGATYTVVARMSPTGPPIVTAPVGGATSVRVQGVPRGTFYITVVATAGGRSSGESNQTTLMNP